MSIVKSMDKRTGITYVYESESYWDKEKQQPRARRKLIGKIDKETGEIIPTDGRGHRRRDKNGPASGKAARNLDESRMKQLLEEKEKVILSLQEENRKLKEQKSRLIAGIEEIIAQSR